MSNREPLPESLIARGIQDCARIQQLVHDLVPLIQPRMHRHIDPLVMNASALRRELQAAQSQQLESNPPPTT